jgi:hypothetical protein
MKTKPKKTVGGPRKTKPKKTVVGPRKTKPKKAVGAVPAPADTSASADPSKLIDERIAQLGDWRGKTLARMRALILSVDRDIVEEWKWRGTPVWSRDGGICTGESYKAVVKLTFHQGASLKDPTKLFNSSLEGNVRRAIDIHEEEEIDAKAFKALVREAISLNQARAKKSPRRK